MKNGARGNSRTPRSEEKIYSAFRALGLSMKPENRTSWQRTFDAVNVTITAALILFVLWTTFR